ncbi:MAG TPA: hypothetical protein VGX23_37325 [Actinocrinis sp.]|nr:hypothetical protein [Actinocrinis sp.]
MIADDFEKALKTGDRAAFAAAVQSLAAGIPRQRAKKVAGAAANLLPVLAHAPNGIGSGLAKVIGGMCDYGADPLTVLPTLVDCAVRVLGDAIRFMSLANESGIALPAPDRPEALPATLTALRSRPRPGFDERAVTDTAEAWFSADDWIQPVLFLAQRKQVRAALPRRAELTMAIDAVRKHIDTANWLHGLLLVLDDEPVVVLHRASGQAWRCTLSGIGDNFQLHTLLAARLAASVGVQPPTPAELAAADTGNPQPDKGIQGNFNLVDAFGAWIWNEGRPADIPRCDGTRVIVIDPAPYPRGWNTGRLYPNMPPTLTVDGRLPDPDAKAWLGKVKPAVSFSSK